MTNRKADNLLLFRNIIDAGSLSVGAKDSGISVSQASKRLTQLENTLGIQLIRRSTRRLALTPPGELLYNKLSNIKAQIEHAWESVLEYANEPRGNLHIATPNYYGLNYLMAFLGEFNQRHPEINVKLDFINHDQINLEQTSYDITFLSHILGPEQLIPDSNLRAKQVHMERLAYVASEQYLSQAKNPIRLKELHQHKRIAINTHQDEPWAFYKNKSIVRKHVDNVFVSNNFESVYHATRNHMGISQLPWRLVQEDIDNNQLVEIFKEYSAETLNTYAYYNASGLASMKVNLFLKELNEHSQKQQGADRLDHS